MITPKELHEKAEKLFLKVAAAHFRGEATFPLVIPSNKQITGTNFSQWENDLVPLYSNSKAAKGVGYSVDWKSKKINGSAQSVPSRIYFDTLDDYLQFTGKSKKFEKIKEAREKISGALPGLTDWATNNPALLLEYSEAWDGLIRVCLYFISNPPPHALYLRELPIEVHSKFIENHVNILKKLLDLVLPTEWVNASESDFVSRYQLRKTTIYTQIRVLDDELKPHLGFDECALALDDASWLSWTPENVFIIENQTCFLTFPKVRNSVAIFGEGFKSRLSKHLPWLEKSNLFCWFDMDTAGFEMVNMIREYYQHAKTIMMDQHTYETFSNFSVENNKRIKSLPNLSDSEKKLYTFLAESSRRLEQERISQRYVKTYLNELFLIEV